MQSSPTEEWVLEPGDILYVPPGVAHNGIAVGDDCMTYSIGFRAPSRSELIAHWCDHVLAELDEDDRYDDPDLVVQANPGEITPAAVGRLQAMIAEKMLDQDAFVRWFGRYNSTPKYPDVDWTPNVPISVAGLRKRLAADGTLYRNPASRFSFVREPRLLFVDSRSFDYGSAITALVEDLCARDRLAVGPDLLQSDAAMELLTGLFNAGSVAFGPRD